METGTMPNFWSAPPITLADLPKECRAVLAADGKIDVPAPKPAIRPEVKVAQ